MSLKSKIAIVSVLVAGIAIVGAGTTKSASSTYEVTADTIEGCSCPLFCTCYFGAAADSSQWTVHSRQGRSPVDCRLSTVD